MFGVPTGERKEKEGGDELPTACATEYSITASLACA